MKERLKEFQAFFKDNGISLSDDEAIIEYFSNPNNQEKRKELQALYLYLYGTRLRGCKNCLVDAFVQIMYYNPESIIEGNVGGKRLLRGVVLSDYKKDKAEQKPFITFGKTTPELLDYYWENYPEYRVYFV